MTPKKACALAVVTSVISLGLLAPLWAAPKDKKTRPAEPAASNGFTENEDVSRPVGGPDAMAGTYVGKFGARRITVCLQNVVGQTLNGYSIVAGNQRAFSGSLDFKGLTCSIHAREPGDHPEDGTFDFVWRLEDKHLTGVWTPNNSKLQARTFDLERRDFKYDPKKGVYPQASTRALKTADVQNLRPEELRVMRNEMYARHGYTFSMKDMREHFEGEDWYMPINFNVVNQLTPIEQHNETLIKKYENYGAQYYDSFGR